MVDCVISPDFTFVSVRLRVLPTQGFVSALQRAPRADKTCRHVSISQITQLSNPWEIKSRRPLFASPKGILGRQNISLLRLVSSYVDKTSFYISVWHPVLTRPWHRQSISWLRVCARLGNQRERRRKI